MHEGLQIFNQVLVVVSVESLSLCSLFPLDFVENQLHCH